MSSGGCPTLEHVDVPELHKILHSTHPKVDLDRRPLVHVVIPACQETKTDRKTKPKMLGRTPKIPEILKLPSPASQWLVTLIPGHYIYIYIYIYMILDYSVYFIYHVRDDEAGLNSSGQNS